MLLVDDLTDTGNTARVVRQMLPNAHFATVYAKPAGAPLCDTFITEVSQDTWIFLPWDLDLAVRPADRRQHRAGVSGALAARRGRTPAAPRSILNTLGQGLPPQSAKVGAAKRERELSMLSFEWLIEPVPPEAFFEDYYEKKPLLIEGNDPANSARCSASRRSTATSRRARRAIPTCSWSMPPAS